MKEAFVNSSIRYLKKNGYNSELEIEKYTYGLEGLYAFVTKISFVLVINIIFGTWLEFLIFHILYSLIRTFAFGTHAKNNFWCWIFTSILFISIPNLIKYIFIDKTIIFVVSVISAIIISTFAPADTKLRPLIHKDKRLVDKILSIIICITYILIIIFVNNSLLSTCLMYALLLEAVMVNPLTYLIFGQSFNNYKNYKG